MRRRPSQTGPVLAAGVIVLAGLGIAAVEAYRLPKAGMWIVVGATVALIALIRRMFRR